MNHPWIPYRFESKRFLSFHVLWIVIPFLIIACVVPRTYFKPSRDVAADFENGKVLAGHRYYASGPKAKPNAVVAIDNAYTLQSDSWREITVMEQSLADLIGTVRQVPGAKEKNMRNPNGARLIGPEGVQIGIWYSVYDYSRVRLSEDGKTVELSVAPTTMPVGATSEGKQ